MQPQVMPQVITCMYLCMYVLLWNSCGTALEQGYSVISPCFYPLAYTYAPRVCLEALAAILHVTGVTARVDAEAREPVRR